MLLCILLIVAALVFGSRETVNIFGFNIYMVQSDTASTAPKGSAVIVRKCSAFELNNGNLVLYIKDGEDNIPALGYVRNVETSDGAYFVTAFADDSETKFSDSELIGRAEYSSVALGKTIAFIRTPWGVLCLAVIPCIVLIAYDILRAAAAKMPPPEVVPQVKNGDGGFGDESGQLLNAARTTGSKLSVNGDGKATLSRKQGAQQGTAAGGGTPDNSSHRQEIRSSQAKHQAAGKALLRLHIYNKYQRERRPQVCSDRRTQNAQ